MVAKRIYLNNNVIAASAIVLALIIARRRRRRRDRKVWVREWIKNRPQLGAYHQLLQELKVTDTQGYRNFLRMDPTTFELLLTKVGPLVTHQDTVMRKAIAPAERIALTLRFLATGKTKVATPIYTISLIIR